MNKKQANMMINMIKNECENHDKWCKGCPFKYIDEEGQEGCIIEDGFVPYDYDNKLLK